MKVMVKTNDSNGIDKQNLKNKQMKVKKQIDK